MIVRRTMRINERRIIFLNLQGRSMCLNFRKSLGSQSDSLWLKSILYCPKFFTCKQFEVSCSQRRTRHLRAGGNIDGWGTFPSSCFPFSILSPSICSCDWVEGLLSPVTSSLMMLCCCLCFARCWRLALTVAACRVRVSVSRVDGAMCKKLSAMLTSTEWRWEAIFSLKENDRWPGVQNQNSWTWVLNVLQCSIMDAFFSQNKLVKFLEKNCLSLLLKYQFKEHEFFFG